MGRPRVLLADDQFSLVAFEKLLTPECEIVGQVADGRALVDAAEMLTPDVIVLDVAIPRLNGLEAARKIKQFLPHVKLVFVAVSEDADLVAGAFRAGAAGYLLKLGAAAELAAAVREVVRGRLYVTPLVTEGLLRTLMHVEEHAAHELTTRQREVLHLLAEGNSMKEAAAVLKLTPRTVAFHKYQMMEQLQIKSTAELIRYAVTHHIV